MCNLSKGVREKGHAEGMSTGMAKGCANGIFDSIKNLVKNLGISAEQVMDVLEIPLMEQQTYMELLEQQ